MDTLYHYCTNHTFLSIIGKRSLCFSSLSLSNDFMEGRLFNQFFAELQYANDPGKSIYHKWLAGNFNTIQKNFEYLGFCLSEKEDLLSQWRGYADDGAGMSIGFSKSYLDELITDINSSRPKISTSALRKIIYDPEDQKITIRETMDRLFLTVEKLIEENICKNKQIITIFDFFHDIKKEHTEFINPLIGLSIAELVKYLYAFKLDGFKEEQEWRIIECFQKDNINHDCSYRISDNKIIPYRKYELKKLLSNPIAEVYIGPKNKTPKYVIDNFLKQNGFDGVEIIISKNSYR